MNLHVFLPKSLSSVSLCVFSAVCDFADYPPSSPAAEQKVHGGVGSLVKGLTLPSNMVPIETRHKTSCQHQTIIKCTCVSLAFYSDVNSNTVLQ